MRLGAGPPSARASNAVRGLQVQPLGKVMAALPDGLLVQARDLGDLADSPVPQPLRFQRRDPPTLAFIQMLHQRAKPRMPLFLGMLGLLLAKPTGTS
jgi:hypothetical protein